MPNTFTTSSFATTYKDDFKDSDHYHRILFNSGKQLQARELTQMQTIIQKEIERFGRNIFREGASVVPGGMTVNNKYEFIKIAATTNLPSDTSSMIGDTFTGQTSGVACKILEVVSATGSDPATIYVQYTNRSSVAISGAAIRMSPAENIVGASSGVTLTVQSINTPSNRAIGRGTKASMQTGTFFTQGHFVQADQQEVMISKYDSAPDENVGFVVNQDIVTVSDTLALYDNQGTLPNLTAPGADRYRIQLTLTTESEKDSADTFVFYGKIRDGLLIETVTGTDEYNKIAQFDAIKTQEINGDFIKKPFKIHYDSASSSEFNINISPGTAYVNGYRANKSDPTVIKVDKALTAVTLQNEPISAEFGNYVIINEINGLPDIENFENQDLRDDSGFGGSTIGTARVKSVEEDGTNWRYYLMDIQMNAGQNFRDVKSLGTSATSFGNLELENTIAVIKDAANNNLLFSFPQSRVKSISDVVLTTQRRLTATADANGNATFPGLGTNEAFENSNQWVFSRVAGGSFSPSGITGNGTQSASITGAPANTAIEVIAQVQKTGILRNKVLTETTVTSTINTPATGAPFVSLGKADIYSVDRIRAVDSDGADLFADFLADNGARDNFYDVGKIILKSNAKSPVGNIFVRFKYFDHTTPGHYFAANSYTGQLDYGDIPTHTLADGVTRIPLTDVIDFRSRKDDAGVGFSAGTARVNELPVNTSLITIDTEYYMPRFDKLVVDQEANLSIVTGAPSLTPQYAPTPQNTLELYRIEMNAGSKDEEDMVMRNIESKGFTMSDIQRLEERVDRLEEATALSLLEVDVNNLAVFDSAGNDRSKSGFLVDNFSDHSSSFTNNPEFRSSIDPLDRVLRPTFNEENVRLIYDSDLSTNAILKGDNVYIKYTEQIFIDQPEVSQTININPFAVITHQGNLTLSPSSDEWKETVYIAPRVINGGIRLNTNQAFLFNNWNWAWQGNNVNNLRLGQVTNSRTTRAGNRITTQRNRVVQDETIRQVIGDRVVNIAIIPFMRSKKIFFRAEGLAPNVQMWARFDGVPVNDWVRAETFQRFAATEAEYGNRTNNITQHPENPSTLFTNANGVVEGSFFIPSQRTGLRFRTGEREFKLMDITGTNERDALSIAKETFEANGVIETRQRDILSTRHITVRGQTSVRIHDPVAQSFFVDKKDGIYLTRLRLFFASKDSTVPVQVEIRPMVNGHPSSDTVLPGSIKFMNPANIITTNDATSPSDFVFDEPVFLQPFTEYAFVVKAESTNYNIYIAETEQFFLNSTEKKITKQPTLGSLFLSQNSTTWEPAQTKDAMFRLYHAQFDTAGATVVLENAPISTKLAPTNPVIFDSSSNRIIINQPNHGFTSGDEVSITGLDSATNYGQNLLGEDVMGARTIIDVDEDNFTFTAGGGKSNSAGRFAFGGNDVITTRNMMFETVVPFLEPLQPQNTGISLAGKFTSGKSHAGTETPFLKDVVDVDLELRENNAFTVPKMIANRGLEIANLGAAVKSATLSVGLSTANPDVCPMLDMQRASMFLIHNHIDQQDSANAPVSAPPHNTPIFFGDETTVTSGSHIGKHVVRPVTLEEAAIGLKILIGAHRPSVADFDLYYKVANDGENFNDIAWTEIAKEESLPSDENPNVFRDYRYLVGGQNGLSASFTRFTVKIVMKSLSSAKPPIFRDLRIIAMAV